MTATLMLAVVDRHEGDLARVAASLSLSRAATHDRVAEARLSSRSLTRTLANVEVAPDTWRRMTARMLLAVIDEAPSVQAAAQVLGLPQRELRSLVRGARRAVA